MSKWNRIFLWALFLAIGHMGTASADLPDDSHSNEILYCSPNCTACPSCNFCGQNCTLSQGFWKTHPECWPVAYNPATQTLCGILWTTILDTPVKGRPWYSLAHQWIAAALNKANGADSVCIASATCEECSQLCSSTDPIGDIGSLLGADCANIDSKDPNSTFNCLEMILDDYNNGKLEGCPEHCGEGNCDACSEGCETCCPFDCSQCGNCPPCTGCTGACPDPCPECPTCPTCPACPDCNCPECPDCICAECPKCPGNGCTCDCKKKRS